MIPLLPWSQASEIGAFHSSLLKEQELDIFGANKQVAVKWRPSGCLLSLHKLCDTVISPEGKVGVRHRCAFLRVFWQSGRLYYPQSNWKLKLSAGLNCCLQQGYKTIGGSAPAAQFAASCMFILCWRWMYLSEHPLPFNSSSDVHVVDSYFILFLVLKGGKQLNSKDKVPHCLMILWWCFMKFLTHCHFKSVVLQTAFMGHWTKTRPLSSGQTVGQCQPQANRHH